MHGAVLAPSKNEELIDLLLGSGASLKKKNRDGLTPYAMACKWIGIELYAHMHTRTRTHTRTHACTHTHTHARTHTCSPFVSCTFIVCSFQRSPNGTKGPGSKDQHVAWRQVADRFDSVDTNNQGHHTTTHHHTPPHTTTTPPPHHI